MATNVFKTTDNNKWISKVTGLPITLSHQMEVAWEKDGPDDPDAVKNPNFGVTTITEEEVPDPVFSNDTGRNLTWDEFLDVGMATDAAKINTVILTMPVIAEFGRKYVHQAGIEFADAFNPDARLSRLIAAAKAATLVDDTFINTFMSKWVELYPAPLLVSQ